MKQATIDKAADLIRANAVSRLPSMGGGMALYRVQGGHADYMVALRGQRSRCSCTAGMMGKDCSHALAVRHTANRA